MSGAAWISPSRAEKKIMGPLSPLHRLVVRLPLWFGVVYLLWRSALTLEGAAPVAAAVLIVAEALGLAVYAGRCWASTGPPTELVDVPDAPLPDTTAVVDAGDASVAELRATLVSLRRVEGVGRIVVAAADSRWARTVAERFGAVACDPAMTVLEAARRAGSSWILFLRGGDLPMADLVTKCAARCSSPTVGIVQVETRESAPTSFEHEPDGHWSLEPFEQEVVRPSLAGRGSLPWYGDGPVMVRRAVLPAAEPPDPTVVVEPRLIGLAVAEAGMTVAHVPLVLARVHGPESLGDLLVRRAARLRAALRAVGPALRRGLPRSTALAHLLGAMPVVVGIQRLLLVASAVLVLGFAQTPLLAGSEFFALALPTYGLRWVGHRLLGRGRLEAFSVLRSDIRSLAVDVVPARFSSAAAARLGVGAVVAIIVVLHGAVLVAGLAIWRDWDRAVPAETTAVALALTAGFVGVAMEVMLDVLARRQRRDTHRVRLGLVTCRVEEHDGQLLDLSMGGVGVSLLCAPIDAPAPGSVTTIAFRIPDADGAWRSVSALVHVAHRGADREGGTRLGLAFDNPTDAPLDPVVEFLTVHRRSLPLDRCEPVIG